MPLEQLAIDLRGIADELEKIAAGEADAETPQKTAVEPPHPTPSPSPASGDSSKAEPAPLSPAPQHDIVPAPPAGDEAGETAPDTSQL